jgi:hypothetical protein
MHPLEKDLNRPLMIARCDAHLAPSYVAQTIRGIFHG